MSILRRGPDKLKPAHTSPAAITPQVIYYRADAPPSVRKTADEIQKYIKAVYGIELPVATNRTDTPMICVGDNDAAAAAGFSGKTLPYESGRIVTQNGNLYIFGHDIADDAKLASGGRSLGTWHAGLTFIEQVLGVKFLMSGESGTYIPSKTGPLSFANLNLIDCPKFVHRQLNGTGPKDDLTNNAWLEHQRYNYYYCGGSKLFSYNHAWQDLFPQPGAPSAKRYGDAFALYEKHPEYFRMLAGNREKPYGQFFMCLTAPGLMEEIARRVGIWYQEREEQTGSAADFCSLSPNDGANWCECTNCAALYDSTNPYFPKEGSMSRAVLNYYNAVAKMVATQYPGKSVTGFIYAGYALPPVPPIKLAGNLYLAWAPTFAYGPWRYDPETGRVWDKIVADWTKCSTNIVYYCVDFWERQFVGAPMPPFRKLLKETFPVLRQAGWLGAYIYGSPGQPLLNYMLAKLSWNPDLDIDAEISAFCRSAYGPGGPDIEKMYDLIETGFAAYANKKGIQKQHNFTCDQLNDIYGKNWPEITRLFASAWKQAVTPAEKSRLGRLKKQLQTTQYHLVSLGMIAAPTDGMLGLDDQQYTALVADDDRALQPTSSYLGSVLKKLEVKPCAGANAPITNADYALFLHKDLLIVPKHDQTVTVEVVGMASGSAGKVFEFPYYEIYDDACKLLQRGLLNKQKLTFAGAKGHHYFLTYLPIGDFTTYQIKCDAPWALGDSIDPQGLRFRSRLPAALDFYVPDAVDSFSVTLAAGGSQADRVSGKILSPDNQVAHTFTKVGLQEISVKKTAGQNGGFWRIAFDDQKIESEFLVKSGRNLAGYFFLEGTNRFAVKLK